MTLAANMITDFHTVHLNTDEHAESVTYTPVGGSPASYDAQVLYQEDLDATEFPDGMFRIRRAQLMLSVASSYGPTTVTEGDAVSIGGVTWKVKGRVHHDSVSQTLALERDELREFGGNRIKR